MASSAAPDNGKQKNDLARLALRCMGGMGITVTLAKYPGKDQLVSLELRETGEHTLLLANVVDDKGSPVKELKFPRTQLKRLGFDATRKIDAHFVTIQQDTVDGGIECSLKMFKAERYDWTFPMDNKDQPTWLEYSNSRDAIMIYVRSDLTDPVTIRAMVQVMAPLVKVKQEDPVRQEEFKIAPLAPGRFDLPTKSSTKTEIPAKIKYVLWKVALDNKPVERKKTASLKSAPKVAGKKRAKSIVLDNKPPVVEEEEEEEEGEIKMPQKIDIDAEL